MASIVPTVLCNGVHAGDSMSPEELSALLDRVQPEDGYSLPICDRPGRRVNGRHADFPNPIPAMIGSGDMEKALLAVTNAATTSGEEAIINLMVADELRPYFPNIAITAYWKE